MDSNPKKRFWAHHYCFGSAKAFTTFELTERGSVTGMTRHSDYLNLVLFFNSETPPSIFTFREKPKMGRNKFDDLKTGLLDLELTSVTSN